MKKEKKFNLNLWTSNQVICFLTFALSFFIVDRFWGFASWWHGLLVIVVFCVIIVIIHAGRSDIDKKN